MPSTRSIHHLDPTMTAPWTRPAPLTDVPGGETNLLHRSAWSDPANPLRVEFKPWYDVPPTWPGTESVSVFLDNDEKNEIGFAEWTLPMGPGDYFIEIRADRLPPGEHELSFIMTNWLGVAARSFPFTVTIDKQEPLLNASSELIFPTDVLPPANKLTARYLEQHNDEVKAAIPFYTTPRPWDRITWYWGETRGNLNKGGVIELDDKNYSDPLELTIPGPLIRDRKDGMRYVWYQLHDRAGNESRPSEPVELNVAATPIPRTLPWPTIEKATGSNELQTLDPMMAITGVVVEIPVEAVIYPGEQAWVYWAEPGSLGARRVGLPITPGQRRYQIDMPAVAAHIGKTLSVSYGVIDEKGIEHPSRARRLQVQTIPSSRFDAVKCDGLSGGTLSYKKVAVEGARLTLNAWTFITTDQWIMITMTGVNSSGLDSVFEAVVKRVVTDQEVIGGIGQSTPVRVPRSFLNSLRRNASLTGKVYVSFDGGKTWPPVSAPNFPLLQLTFVD